MVAGHGVLSIQSVLNIGTILYSTSDVVLAFVCLVLTVAPCRVLLYLTVSSAKQPGAVRISGGVISAGVDDDHRCLYGGM